MKIQKILNNNVVSSFNDEKQEVIAMGKGIAFGKKVGDWIDKDLIDKLFKLDEGLSSYQVYGVLEEIPEEYWEVTNRIIKMAQTSLGKRFNNLIYLTVGDHIYSTVNRYREGVILKNTFLWDIRHFYIDEYKIGEFALKEINKTFEVNLAEDEIGFIAMHFVNAQMDSSIDEIFEMSEVMQEVTNIIKYYFNIELDESSVHYFRYITHLKYFAKRLVSNTVYEGEEDIELLELVKRKYKNSYKCAKQISSFIQNKYSYIISVEELLYLTIHIQRLVYKA